MQKNIEEIKKIFEEKILVTANKLCFAFLVINYVLFWVNIIYRRYLRQSVHYILIAEIAIYTSMLFLCLAINISCKWKTKITRYICTIVPIIMTVAEMCLFTDYDNSLFLLAYLLTSVVYLQPAYILLIGALSIIGIVIAVLYKIFISAEATALVVISFYYYSFITMAILTGFFYFVCKMLSKIMLNEQIDQYEIEKSKKDSTLAGKIQEGFLNCDFPSNEVYDLSACMIPSKNVGGDFYDFYEIDKSRFAMLVADVSGKGIPASLLMANAKAIIRDYVTKGVSFEKSMEMANRDIMRENKELQFVTLFICIVDLTTGKLNYINAGHVKPFVIGADASVSTIVSKPDFVFGVRKDTRYHSNEYVLKPGDKLFLCTDGVTERLDANDKLYGKERLKEVLVKNYDKKVNDIIPYVLDSLNEYGKNREQNDDITCLMFNYKKPLVLAPPIVRDFDVAKDKTAEIISYITGVFEDKNVPKKIINLMAVASDEIISNVSKYAYEGSNADKKLNVHIEVYDKEIITIFTDYGKYFNPLSKITLSGTTKVTDKSKIGGLGIQLTWNIMDGVEYYRIDDKNMIYVKKEF